MPDGGGLTSLPSREGERPCVGSPRGRGPVLYSLEQVSAPNRLLRVNARDNCAVVVTEGGLPAGAVVDEGLTLRDDTPQAHKVALHGIAAGAPVVRYGEVIGHAVETIPAGAWIREEMLRLPEAPALDRLAESPSPPPELPPLDGYTFDGYPNDDGTAGTKNLLGLTTTVQCVAPTVEYAARRIRAELLPRYPHVDGVVALTHPYGCGVAINAAGAEIPIRTLRNIARNPNFGGEAMVVSLGCEKLQPVRLFPQDAPPIVRLQDEQHVGFEAMVAAIVRQAEQHLERLNRRRRVPCPASQLIVGLQCGGSDAMSGVTANPAVGFAADLLVRAGATVMFSEVSEVRDAIHLLTARSATPEVARQLVAQMAWYDAYLARCGVDRSANPTPGNKRGGLANIVEKALGSVAKSGSAAIRGVVPPGERVSGGGLHFAATPASDFICGTLQLAAGMNVHVFTTGEGTPYGLALAPVIKVSSRTALARRWPDLIDVDAGRIASGAASIEETGWEVFRLILDVASGRRQTWADRHGLHNDLALFNPAPVT